jgi:hypothetical protein
MAYMKIFTAILILALFSLRAQAECQKLHSLTIFLKFKDVLVHHQFTENEEKRAQGIEVKEPYLISPALCKKYSSQIKSNYESAMKNRLTCSMEEQEASLGIDYTDLNETIERVIVNERFDCENRKFLTDFEVDVIKFNIHASSMPVTYEQACPRIVGSINRLHKGLKKCSSIR